MMKETKDAAEEKKTNNEEVGGVTSRPLPCGLTTPGGRSGFYDSKPILSDAVVGISIAILVILYCVQQCACTFNPKYIVDYFNRNGKQAWICHGGVFLCITGAEAMFADLGHFNVRAIQIGFSSITFPTLITAYSDQAAFLTKYPDKVADTFYASIPRPLYWPMFVVAIAATIVTSQATIFATFSIISQSQTLGCFPRVKVVHTLAKYEGQVYIPEVNYVLMVACVLVTATFKTTEKTGNAYGIVVVSVMVITTCMVLYLSSVLYKFIQGGYLPLVFAFSLMTIMVIWHYVHKECFMFELENKVSSDFIRDLAKNPNVNRIPRIGFLYSELIQGIPPILPHLISNIPAIHPVLVIVSIKNLPISRVVPEERFFFRQLEPRNLRIFRCIVRYGYKDAVQEPEEFEQILVENLKEFFCKENFILEEYVPNQEFEPMNMAHVAVLAEDENANVSEELLEQPSNSLATHTSMDSLFNVISSMVCSAENLAQAGPEAEVQFVQSAMEKGVVYLLGQVEVAAEPNSSLFEKIVVNYAYKFLWNNFRQGEKIMAIPRPRLLRVGMMYEI
ncbi:hypothetical protein CDL15_Pgr009911 [Punica granatum]|uniref:Potassium transporter n=1 Tax=Punica granatum TaxID=22663 RepID=A0A218WU21_PUNGR|nr:hypothetical protein CDL15_Pgr009911 [Punica granatum]